MNTEALGYAVDYEDLLLLMGGRGKKVACKLNGEPLGGVRSIGEGTGVPYVFGVSGVEFWILLVYRT